MQQICCIIVPRDYLRGGMKYSEFRKWLKKQGAMFEKHRSGSSHYRVTLNGKTTIFPDHGSKEIGTGLVEAIKKQLGIK